MNEIFFQLILAVILGGIIGSEREIAQGLAGLRTHVLVCLAATLFTILSLNGFPSNADPSRVASQIVSGIGFLGAGLIIFYGTKLRGITTAAGIWITAAIGMAVGLKFYLPAIFVTFLAIMVLFLFRPVEYFLDKYFWKKYKRFRREPKISESENKNYEEN